MRTFDFYEFAAILAPGTVFFTVYGLFSPAWTSIKERAISLGDLGIFVIAAYAAGHLIQGIGNLMESLWWWFRRGWPADWIRSGVRPLLADTQVQRLKSILPEQLGIALPDNLSDLSGKQWASITRQIEASLRKTGTILRSDVFNANYGLCRGVATALLLNMVVCPLQFGTDDWRTAVLLLLLLSIALHRMDRFGQHYAGALFNQFIQSAVAMAGVHNRPDAEVIKGVK